MEAGPIITRRRRIILHPERQKGVPSGGQGSSPRPDDQGTGEVESLEGRIETLPAGWTDIDRYTSLKNRLKQEGSNVTSHSIQSAVQLLKSDAQNLLDLDTTEFTSEERKNHYKSLRKILRLAHSVFKKGEKLLQKLINSERASEDTLIGSIAKGYNLLMGKSPPSRQLSLQLHPLQAELGRVLEIELDNMTERRAGKTRLAMMKVMLDSVGLH